jgi:hypothetical protein
VHYHGEKFITVTHGGKLKDCGNLPQYLNPKNVGTAVIYHTIFITLAPGGRNWQLIYLCLGANAKLGW